MTVARCQSMAAFYMPSSPLWTTQTSPTSSSCQRPVRLTSGSSWRWLTRTAGKYNLVTSVQVPPQLWLRLQTRDKECNSIPGLPRSQDDYLLPGLAALLAVFPGAGVPQPPGHQVTVIRHQVSDTITGSLSLSRIPGSASASWPAQWALLRVNLEHRLSQSGKLRSENMYWIIAKVSQSKMILTAPWIFDHP